jgi:hypothetical protein
LGYLYPNGCDEVKHLFVKHFYLVEEQSEFFEFCFEYDSSFECFFRVIPFELSYNLGFSPESLLEPMEKAAKLKSLDNVGGFYLLNY